MTRKQLQKTILGVIIFYSIVLFIAVSGKAGYYQLIKDMMPLIIAIPAAYLGFCFQRRSSFLQALRPVWSNLIAAVNSAIQYTHQIETTNEKYGETLVMISRSIDEIRGLYRNLDEHKDGAGPFSVSKLEGYARYPISLGFRHIRPSENFSGKERADP